MLQHACNTLIMSDLHLGSELSQAKQALRMLQSTEFHRLVLLGDIFCDLNFGRLKKDHWKFLGYIRKLTNPKRRKEVVWVEGNHDKGLSTVMSHLVGIPVYQKYEWKIGDIHHIAVHGHQFDHFTLRNDVFCSIGSALFLQLQKLDSSQQLISRRLDRLNTSWLGLSAKVRDGAFRLAASVGAQRVFCGHTHVAVHETRNEIDYLNAGCWTIEQPSYIAVDEDSAVLRYWEADDEVYTADEDTTEPDTGDLEFVS
jgi:UDP-2,3-diacylglucosamine pyrophosphatase LpxH